MRVFLVDGLRIQDSLTRASLIHAISPPANTRRPWPPGRPAQARLSGGADVDRHDGPRRVAAGTLGALRALVAVADVVRDPARDRVHDVREAGVADAHLARR